MPEFTVNTGIPAKALEAVFTPTVSVPEGALEVRGYDFNQGLNWDGIMNAYKSIGYQATSLGKAIEIIQKMVSY